MSALETKAVPQSSNQVMNLQASEHCILKCISRSNRVHMLTQQPVVGDQGYLRVACHVLAGRSS